MAVRLIEWPTPVLAETTFRIDWRAVTTLAATDSKAAKTSGATAKTAVRTCAAIDKTIAKTSKAAGRMTGKTFEEIDKAIVRMCETIGRTVTAVKIGRTGLTTTTGPITTGITAIGMVTATDGGTTCGTSILSQVCSV